MDYFTQAFLSLFKPRPRMTQAENFLLDPKRVMSTDIFLYIFTSWASSASDPFEIFNRFPVTCIMHNKLPSNPEHEFLIIETEDRLHNNRKQLFILERTMTDQTSLMETSPESSKPFGKFLEMVSPSHDSQLSLIEEGLVSSTSTVTPTSLLITDKGSLISLQSADCISDSLDKLQHYPAQDQFLGAWFTTTQKFHGQNVRYFKPNNLSLFELALLANTIHIMFPRYSLLEHQCYFFASLICATVETHFGIQPSKLCNDPDSGNSQNDYVIDSHLPNNYGRWKGMKVQVVNPEDVAKVVRKFKTEHTSVISQVILFILTIQMTDLQHSLQIMKATKQRHEPQATLELVRALVQPRVDLE